MRERRDVEELTAVTRLHEILVDLEARTRSAHLPVFADALTEAIALLDEIRTSPATEEVREP